MEQANKDVHANISGVQNAMKDYAKRIDGVKEWTETTARLCQTAKDRNDQLDTLQKRVEASEKALTEEVQSVRQELHAVARKQDIINKTIKEGEKVLEENIETLRNEESEGEERAKEGWRRYC